MLLSQSNHLTCGHKNWHNVRSPHAFQRPCFSFLLILPHDSCAGNPAFCDGSFQEILYAKDLFTLLSRWQQKYHSVLTELSQLNCCIYTWVSVEVGGTGGTIGNGDKIPNCAKGTPTNASFEKKRKRHLYSQKKKTPIFTKKIHLRLPPAFYRYPLIIMIRRLMSFISSNGYTVLCRTSVQSK